MFPRDVLRIHDRLVDPPKVKIFICVCHERRLFLRINTRSYFPPHHLIFEANNDFLDHDSYVELKGLLQLPAEDCAEAEHIGRLAPGQARELYEAINEWGTLPPTHLEIVRDRWVIR